MIELVGNYPVPKDGEMPTRGRTFWGSYTPSGERVITWYLHEFPGTGFDYTYDNIVNKIDEKFLSYSPINHVWLLPLLIKRIEEDWNLQEWSNFTPPVRILTRKEHIKLAKKNNWLW